VGLPRNTDTFLERKMANSAKNGINGGLNPPAGQMIQSQK
jgi:hypothetical protein